jgi:transcriptional regulator with XRE-family HTH domain
MRFLLQNKSKRCNNKCRMKDVRLDGDKVRSWLKQEDRKLSFLTRQLGISGSLVSQMLCKGYVPKEDTVQALATLMGIKMNEILIPNRPAKRAC